jgi:tetratricopeptide (TPR) repeat protein
MSIAVAQAKIGQRDHARASFAKAIQLAKEIKPRDPLRDRAGSDCLDSHECLRTIAYAQAHAGFAADAIHTAETIHDPKRKNSAFSLIAMAMAKAGDIKSAIQLVDTINDQTVKSRALQDFAEAQAHAGDISGAEEWAKSQPSPNARAEALLGSVRAIAKRPAMRE